MTTNDSKRLTDQELLDATARAAARERTATAELLTLLAEVDARRLYLGEGCSSLFTYCTQVLRLSEHAAYHRIEAARAGRTFPVILKRIAAGELTLTTVAMLRPQLTEENHVALLDAARHKSKREVEHQMACQAPKPELRPMVRRVPGSASAATCSEAGALSGVGPASARSHVAPVSSDRYLLRVTLSADGQMNLRRAQDLMRHTNPNADPAVVIERALALLVDQLEKTKAAKTSRPRGTTRRTEKPRSSRNIPAAVRRLVWARDQGRCAFVGARGRCTETGRLEFHHVVPFARGGAADTDNISLRCRAHNGYESELLFGPRLPGARQIATRSGPS